MRKAARDDKPASAAIVARLLQARLDLLAHPKVKPCRFVLEASGKPSEVRFTLARRDNGRVVAAETMNYPGGLGLFVATLAERMEQANVTVEQQPTISRLCSTLPPSIGDLAELRRYSRLVYDARYDEQSAPSCDLGCTFLTELPLNKTLLILSRPEMWEHYKEVLGPVEGRRMRDIRESTSIGNGIDRPGWYEVRIPEHPYNRLAEAVDQPKSEARLLALTESFIIDQRRIIRWTLTLIDPDGRLRLRRSQAVVAKDSKVIERCGYEGPGILVASPIGNFADSEKSNSRTSEKINK